MGITDTNVENYRRELDLQTGIAATAFTHDGVEYAREHFVSSPDQVMVTRLTASEKAKLSVTIQMELNNGGLSGSTVLNNQKGTCTINGTVKDNGLKFRTTMKVIPVGGTMTANANNTYTVENADSIMIIMAAETDYKNDYPVYRDTNKDLAAVVDTRVEMAAAKNYDTLKNNHLADHQELFDRVSMDLGEVNTNVPTNTLVERYRNGEYSKYLEILSFQFGRYLTIAGSRGTLPSNLVGLWTVGDSAWTGDYHFNVNVQMNYWPVYVTNLAECGTTMVEYMENLREPGRLTAERVHGITNAVEEHTGFTVHTENNPFGMTAPTNAQEYGWNPTGAAWAIQNLWAHYEFTQDEDYLKNVIYPIMKEAVLFWDQYLWTSGYQVIHDENSPYNGQARLVVAPSFSEEQGPTAIGTTYDQSLVWELYNECIQAGKIAGEDQAVLAQWEQNMQRLDPIEINATNGIKEWYEETRVGTESGHNKSYAQAGNLAEIAVPNSGWNIGHPGEQRHASHLVGLYPGTLINKDNEEYMSAAVQSLTERGEYSTGWSKANKINLWARTGNGNKAYRLLNNLIGGNTAGLQYNLFDSHGSGGGDTMKNGSPVWQIDGNYGLTSGVAEMLLQSQLGYVQFLPAIPDAWEEGEVQGLKARGNFTIGQKWQNGLAETFTVCYEGSEASSQFVGEYENITKASVYLDGEKITVEKDIDKGQISFRAQQGKVYTIDLTGTNTEKLKEKAEEFLGEIHVDLVKIKEELKEAIATSAANLSMILQKAKLVNKMYEAYKETAENIYYMTDREGLTLKQIDTMYNDLQEFFKAALENNQGLEYYQNKDAELELITDTMRTQMERREIIFSKESGAVTAGANRLELRKNSNVSEYDIRYTLDGTVPCSESPVYQNAITLSTEENTVVRAALYLKNQRVSPVYTKQYTASVTVNSISTNAINWDGYTPEAMIDGNAETRWASKSPSGEVEIIMSFENAISMNQMRFEQFVSYRNATDGFEIWALVNDEYQKVYEGTDLGDGSDDVGGNRAYKTVEFPTVTTAKIKIILKSGYTGEPSFYEIQPIFMEEVKDIAGNSEKLNAMIQLAEVADRTASHYQNADEELKGAFEESIQVAKKAIGLSQAELDSREEFLRNRYNRLGFDEAGYSIIYHLNGGENSSENPVSYMETTPTITLKDATRTGYDFDGWYSDKECTKPAKTIEEGSIGNKVFYAKWVAHEYSIAFKGNGSTSGSMKTLSDRKYGKSYTLTPNAFKRKDYTFAGWNTKADGSGTAYADKASVENLTAADGGKVALYAQWKRASYSITYVLKGGENSSRNPESYTKVTSTITLKSPTRTGYTFKGWYSDSKYTKRVKTIQKGSTGNKTLYAKWEAKKYDITYKLNGGKNSSKNPASYKITTKDIHLQNPSKKGYTFAGWYSDKACTKPVETISKGSTGDKTLYAKWEVKEYRITYNLKGGKNSSKNPSGYTVEDSKITLKSPTRKGYTFKGWYSDAKCTKRVKTIQKGSTGNKTLYAKWSKK